VEWRPREKKSEVKREAWKGIPSDRHRGASIRPFGGTFCWHPSGGCCGAEWARMGEGEGPKCRVWTLVAVPRERNRQARGVRPLDRQCSAGGVSGRYGAGLVIGDELALASWATGAWSLALGPRRRNLVRSDGLRCFKTGTTGAVGIADVGSNDQGCRNLLGDEDDRRDEPGHTVRKKDLMSFDGTAPSPVSSPQHQESPGSVFAIGFGAVMKLMAMRAVEDEKMGRVREKKQQRRQRWEKSGSPSQAAGTRRDKHSVGGCKGRDGLARDC
jgi:hypothetical protein